MISKIEIPFQLQNKKFRFCKLHKKDKRPYEIEWEKKGYTYDDPTLIKHLEEGNNYGVIGGYNNVLINVAHKSHKKRYSLHPDLHREPFGIG